MAQTRTTVFEPVLPANRVDYPALEREVQRWWDEQGILAKYLHRNDHSPKRFSFIDGPITANNPMGVHHAWGRTYKDLFQRYKTLQGYRQRYQNGFDCQGLWVEVEVEKELGLKTKRDIESYGIDAFVERCKERVLRFARRQTEQSIRLGYWMDWDHSYYTMSDENNYTIWGMLKLCHKKGYIYKGHDVMPWCPRCETGISDMEINEGRGEVTHTSVYVRLPLAERENDYLLVWTTTPWTLPANVAAAVNPDLTYVKVKQDDAFYYLSQDVLPKLAKLRGKDKGEAQVVEVLPGRDMLGWKYHGPFDDLPAEQGVEHRIVSWDEVSASEGTGIVHIAPGCGREDFMLSKEHHLAVLAPVDESGTYLDGYGWLTGHSVTEVEGPEDKRVNVVARFVFDDLKKKGLFYQTESYKHVYPHCWRCKTELIFRLVDEWFISMRELRHQMMEHVQRIRWIPSFGLDREMDWLRNMEDWMISKKRYWGLALPIYECTRCGQIEVIGSETELKERAVAGWEEFAGHTPHRPWVDAVKIACPKCGAVVSRIKDVGNPWLDAGIVPYSTLDYRHNKAYWREWFPADFITESFPGQFRNWFYSMLVMSAALENTEPFKTVLGFATLLDQNGEEMHKSKGNSIEFDKAAELVGADTMRWLYMNHPPEQNLRFPRIPTEQDAEEAQKKGQPIRLSDLWLNVRASLDKLWNVYSFFVTYANIDHFDPTAHHLAVADRSDLDRWILSELQQTIAEMTKGLDLFDTEKPAEALSAFLENLSNWYVRRSRRRFWKSEEDQDKVAAYLTLYECLVTGVKLLAPFTPFLTEALYRNLVARVNQQAPESVHLSDWPVADPALVDERLARETRLVLRLVNLGRSAREKAQIRVRQPLSTLYVRVTSDEERESLSRLADQVLEELNIKRLEFLPEESDMLVYTLKPRISVLGPKYGALMKGLLAAISKLDTAETVRTLRATGEVTLAVGEVQVTLTSTELEAAATARSGYVAAEEAGYVVAIETTLTPELLEEGLVRDLTHFLQDLRKKADFQIEETINAHLVTDAELAAVLLRYSDYIKDEVLARQLVVQTPETATGPSESAWQETLPAAKLGGHQVTVALSRHA
jgi:isoleucyl-tRNA synthetase